MASSSNSVGINWAFLSRVSIIVAFVFFGLLLRPAGVCMFERAQVMQIPTIEDVGGGTSDTARVRGALEFNGGIAASIRRCYGIHRIERQPIVLLAGFGISLLVAFVLTAIARLTYRRQVAQAAAAQQKARQDLEKRRTASHTVVGQQSPVSRGPATMTGGHSTLPSMGATGESPRTVVRSFGAPTQANAAFAPHSSTLPTGQEPPLAGLPPNMFGGRPGSVEATPGPTAPVARGIPPHDPAVAAVSASSAAPLDPQAAAAPAPVFGWDVDWNDDEFEKMLRKVTTSSMPAIGSSLAHPSSTTGTQGLADALGLDDRPVASEAFDERDETADAPVVPLGPARAEPHIGTGAVSATPEKIVMPDAVYADRDPRFGLRVSASDPSLAANTRVDVRLVTADGIPQQIWPSPRSLASLAGSEALATSRTATISIPWRDVANEVGRLVERQAAKGASLRVSVATGDEEVFAVAPILDALTLDLVADGEPIAPTIVRITSPSGRVLRAVVGAEQPGRLAIRGIEPGPYELSFEQGNLFAHQNGATAPRLSARTDAIYGLTHARGDGQIMRRRILVVTPRIAYVMPGGTATGDGSRDNPFDRVSTAIAALVSARTNPGPTRPVEIRLSPGSRDLRERLDLARAPDGTVPWEAWWAEKPVPTSNAWTVDVDETELRIDARRDAPGSFHFDVSTENHEALRIVNAAYAEAREAAAREPERLFQLDAELARIPLVELGAPNDEIRNAFRMTITGCADVILEGIHFVGTTGQSGLSLVDCRAVRVHRCLFEHFESGSVARSGAWAVGRGVQIERCGEPERPVEFVLCEFGWNRSTRKSMPIKGAGVAVYDANVRLTRCFIHHNVSSAQPPDIYASGQSRVSGDATNHRESNRVEPPTKVGG